ncbi:MAG: hypothetical protein EA397_07020 [Deltaproteobacteria bacterium]|nr:MAG: hypothetical protein EA397_07020 [Deltaproteobacteria bacterium]
MDELENARSELQAHREALRATEVELAEKLDQLASVAPRGWLGRLVKRSDPGLAAEIRNEIVEIKSKLRQSRERVQAALAEVERIEREAERDAMVPARAVDPASAALVLRVLERLGPLLVRLLSLSGAAKRDRAAQRGPKKGRRRFTDSRSKQGSAPDWDRGVAEAEILADAAGLPLTLPRYRASAPRPAGYPQPSPAIAMARQAALAGPQGDFALVMEMAESQLRQVEAQRVLMVAAIERRYPEARDLAAQIECDAEFRWLGTSSEEQRGVVGEQQLIEAWEALTRTYEALRRGVERGDRVVELLGPVGQWQRQVRVIRDLPLAQEHDLLPPTNEGTEMTIFVERLQEIWPSLNARFLAWRQARERG